ncbi:hypothetical protein MGWOODY_Mmi2242 [hydrothermal vent metagenome]|uniref:Uncharacterized protein n=1 Tax=hydrothermal vent metagenome TaxID=652676 RepID=A0A160VCQ7_9ZZZZ
MPSYQSYYKGYPSQNLFLVEKIRNYNKFYLGLYNLLFFLKFSFFKLVSKNDSTCSSWTFLPN